MLHHQGHSRDLHYLITRDFLAGWGHPGWSRWISFPVKDLGLGTLEYLTAVLYKWLLEKMDLAACRGVWWEAERSGHRPKEGKFKLNLMKNFFPMKRIKQWHRLPREIESYVSLIFSIPEWTSPEQPCLSSYLTLLTQEIGPDTSWGLFQAELSCGPTILWCQPSHADIKTWNLSNTWDKYFNPTYHIQICSTATSGHPGLVSLPHMAMSLSR